MHPLHLKDAGHAAFDLYFCTRASCDTRRYARLQQISLRGYFSLSGYLKMNLNIPRGRCFQYIRVMDVKRKA